MELNSWKSDEIKNLFDLIKDFKNQNKSISSAFSEYANRNNRKENSVRNYYYFALEYFEKHKEESKKFGIDLKGHSKLEVKPFTDLEKNKLIDNIDMLVNKGYSVRRACLELANGNVSDMIRFQNKYRSVKCEKRSVDNKNDVNNVITMPQRKTQINDSEIESLFMGLVRLVKKTAIVEAREKIKNELENSEVVLKKCLLDLSTKDLQLTELKNNCKSLEISNKLLKQELLCVKANPKNSKVEKVKQYLKANKTEISTAK